MMRKKDKFLINVQRFRSLFFSSSKQDLFVGRNDKMIFSSPATAGQGLQDAIRMILMLT